MVAVDPEDPNGEPTWRGWRVLWSVKIRRYAGPTPSRARFTSGTDGKQRFLASAGDEFNDRGPPPEIVVHSVEGDMTTQTVSVTANRRTRRQAATRTSSTALRSQQMAAESSRCGVDETESCDGEDNDQQDDYKPSAKIRGRDSRRLGVGNREDDKTSLRGHGVGRLRHGRKEPPASAGVFCRIDAFCADLCRICQRTSSRMCR